jgi:hypothetical protein
MGKLRDYFLVVFLERLVSIKQLVINLLELLVLLLELMEFLVHEGALGGSQLLCILFGGKVDKLVPLDDLGHKVHEHIFLILGHVKNCIKELFLPGATQSQVHDEFVDGEELVIELDLIEKGVSDFFVELLLVVDCNLEVEL